MNIYLLSQDQNRGWDTYDAAVVAAETEDDARHINPGGDWDCSVGWTGWVNSPDQVNVALIGEAASGTAAGVVLASFHAW